MLLAGVLVLVFMSGCACRQGMDTKPYVQEPLPAVADTAVYQEPGPASKFHLEASSLPGVISTKPRKHDTVKVEKEDLQIEPVPVAPSKMLSGQEPKASPSGIDLDTLTERLKQTPAIGVFTKLAIRSDIMDLKDEITDYRQKSVLQSKLEEVRSRFDGLLMKIVALLEDDPGLSRDLYTARESIWKSLLEVST